jgi:hypothetical protein
MADNEWMPVTIERGAQLHKGAYQIDGDTVAVVYNDRTMRVELGNVTAEVLAKILLGEMIGEG